MLLLWLLICIDWCLWGCLFIDFVCGFRVGVVLFIGCLFAACFGDFSVFVCSAALVVWGGS